MFLLNIFQNTDGTTAWDNILILLVVFVAGYLLNRFSKQQNEKIKQSRETKEWEKVKNESEKGRLSKPKNE